MKYLVSDLAKPPDVAVKQAGNAQENVYKYIHTYIQTYSTYIDTLKTPLFLLLLPQGGFWFWWKRFEATS